MKRLLCGSVVLATSLVLVSCNSDPTSDFRNGPSRILADPSTVFVNHDAVEEVVVTLVDDQGDPLPGSFEVSASGTGITVERNPDFLGTTVGAPLESQAQFIVTAGATPTPTSFTLASGDLSLEIPVNVLPTAIESAAFSNPTPALNEPVTISAEGYAFLPDAAVVIGGDSAAILSNDGSTVTFVPTPGSTGPAFVEKIAISFLPTTPLSLPTTAEITVPPGPVAGTEAAATAPALPIPGVGEFTVFFDQPDFVATIDHFYKLTVTEAGTYTITMDWDIGSDIDLFVCEDPPAADFSNCPASSFVDHPEETEVSLTPGTYFVVGEDFGADAIGTELKITVQHDPAAPGVRKLPAAVRKVRK
jgi:hypothetical protein